MFINEPELKSFALKIIAKVWGIEFIVVAEKEYTLKFMKVKPGHQCSIHRHGHKTESFVGLTGNLILNLHESDKSIRDTIGVGPGDQFRIPAGQFHSFLAHTETWFIEVSTYDSDKDCERIQESRNLYLPPEHELVSMPDGDRRKP